MNGIEHGASDFSIDAIGEQSIDDGLNGGETAAAGLYILSNSTTFQATTMSVVVIALHGITKRGRAAEHAIGPDVNASTGGERHQLPLEVVIKDRLYRRRRSIPEISLFRAYFLIDKLEVMVCKGGRHHEDKKNPEARLAGGGDALLIGDEFVHTLHGLLAGEFLSPMDDVPRAGALNDVVEDLDAEGAGDAGTDFSDKTVPLDAFQ
jgi:hypothetical protein